MGKLVSWSLQQTRKHPAVLELCLVVVHVEDEVLPTIDGTVSRATQTGFKMLRQSRPLRPLYALGVLLPTRSSALPA